MIALLAFRDGVAVSKKGKVAMRRFVICLLLLLSGMPAERAAEPGVRAAEQPVFRSSTTLVALQVTVTHGEKLVTGLEANDFAVLEDGVRQRLEFFDSHEVPLDVVLLVDMSRSMSDKMDAVHETAGAFMRTLRPHDRGAVIGFNESLKVIQPLTGDRMSIASAIAQTRPHGTTALRKTLYVAFKQFASRPATTNDIRRQTFVLLTDGEDNQSLVSYEETLSAARNSGANIYVIVLRPTRKIDAPRPTSSESDFEMRRRAEETGGAAFFAEGVDRLKVVYSVVAAELAAKYSLAYSPNSGVASGREFRRIEVQVVSNASYRARARRGYTAVPLSGGKH